MCGIAGAAWVNPTGAVTAGVLERMLLSIAHRGPDASGTWFSQQHSESGLGAENGPQVALGHRRLSIIDLDSGQQPLSNEDGAIRITFNGEIYNYRELRPQLEAAGHRFQTNSDTEVIVHLYEQYGVDCVNHLRGMFAFAIWDNRDRSLFLARDRLGQKPLFYRADSNRLVFASELKALLQLPNAPRDLDVTSLGRFLTLQYVPHPYCMLQGYNKLPPAHCAVYRDGALTINRYWSPPYTNEITTRSASDWRAELREVMTESVKLRMRSDVPLGAFLSGGVDSTIIAGLMQQMSSQPVHTFSIGFPVEKFDERHFAREAAAFLGTEHHEQLVEPSALSILPKLVWQYDEPFADSSAIPTMYLSQMTREHVTVSLSGDAGDELFAGYDRYKAVRLAGKLDRLPKFVRWLMGAKWIRNFPVSVEQKSIGRRVKRLLEAMHQTPERRYLRWVSIFNAEMLSQVLTDDALAAIGENDPAQFVLDAYQMCPDRDFVTRTTCVDVNSYLPCDLLTKVDIASMTFGLECRGPFLDHKVVELAAQMPLKFKQDQTQGKKILIETFSDLLPRSIQTRRKMGFGVPIDHWFRHELKPLLHDVLLSEQCRNRGLFREATVEKLIHQHTRGEQDHAYRLWALLCFELWARTILDQSSPTPISL